MFGLRIAGRENAIIYAPLPEGAMKTWLARSSATRIYFRFRPPVLVKPPKGFTPHRRLELAPVIRKAVMGQRAVGDAQYLPQPYDLADNAPCCLRLTKNSDHQSQPYSLSATFPKALMAPSEAVPAEIRNLLRGNLSPTLTLKLFQ